MKRKVGRSTSTGTAAVAKSGDFAQSIQDKFTELQNRLAKVAVGQQDMIDAIVLGLLSRHHVLFIGPPGCNKTGLFDKAVHLIGGNERTAAMHEGRVAVESDEQYAGRLAQLTYTFKVTLSKFDQPESLLGPYDPRALREGKWSRNVTATIADCDYAYLSEVFNANGSTLRSVNRVLNEREYENAGIRYALRLRSVFADTNEEPVESMLAVYDRFMIRLPVHYISDNERGDFMRMMNLPQWDEDAEQPVMGISDVDAAYVMARRVRPGAEALDEMWKLRQNLAARDKIVLSDRRWRQTLDVLGAAAWLRGSDLVEAPDLWFALRFVLWDRPSQRDKIAEVLEPYRVQTIAAREGAIMQDIERSFDDAMQQGTVPSDRMSALVLMENQRARIRDEQNVKRLNEMVEQLTQVVDSDSEEFLRHGDGEDAD